MLAIELSSAETAVAIELESALEISQSEIS